MAIRTLNLDSGRPTLEEARRRLLDVMEQFQQSKGGILKVIHGYGSSGEGGVLQVGIRRSLRLRQKEGRVRTVIPGEQFSSDLNTTQQLLRRHPYLRGDRDLNRSNPGITIVEVSPSGSTHD